MRNLKLEIEYDGTNYCGWQIQNAAKSCKPSIQETIERPLRKILQEKIKLIVSGRTDAGVHAKAQVVNFRTESKITLGRLQRALNGNLPDDITISRIEEASPKFHSRFDAKSKVYRYTVLNRAYPSALLRNQVYFYRYPLGVKLMRQVSKCLLGKHDFKAFCASGSNIRETVRTIKRIRIKESSSLVLIDIEADGFLYNMVRNITGTLIEVGRGKLAPHSLKKILYSRDRKLAGPTLPARGLCLLKVKY